MVRTPTALLSPADQDRRRGLQVMKGIALGALLLAAAVFAFAFAFQEQIPWLVYVRAAAEGAMVGALADWFAVTALFRHPLGIPIPHTAIIPKRKDEIGRTLGEFVETEFLRGDVVRTKLESTAIAAKLGDWLRDPAHAERVTAEGSVMASGVLEALSDDDVQDVIEDLAREHLIAPDWGPPLGAWLSRIVESGAHHGAVDMADRQHRDVARGEPRGVHGARLAAAPGLGALGRPPLRRRHRLQRGGEVRRRGAGRAAASGPHRHRRIPRPPRRQPAARPRDDRHGSKTPR